MYFNGQEDHSYQRALVLLAKFSSNTNAGLLYMTPLEGNDVASEYQPGLFPYIDLPPAVLFRCGLTRAVCLGDALKAIFANPAIAARILKIVVRSGEFDVTLYGVDGRRSRFISDTDGQRLGPKTSTPRGKVMVFQGSMLA